MRISDWSSDVCSSDLLLAAYEEARPLAIEAQKRQLGELESKIVTGDVTRDDVAAAITWTSDLSACAADALTAARANKSALENELPASLVQLTEQVEYGRQFQQALEQYCGKQAEEAARSEEHTSELQSLMRLSYAVLCFKEKTRR